MVLRDLHCLSSDKSVLFTRSAEATLVGAFSGVAYGATSATFDISSIVSGYQSLTVDDFFIAGMSVASFGASGGSGGIAPTLSYNASTGIVTVSPIFKATSGPNYTASGTVYLMKGWKP